MITNKLKLRGKVISTVSFSHEIYYENFYTFMLEIERKNGYYDEIPIVFPEKMLILGIEIGDFLEVEGQFRSYNPKVGKLELYVWANNIIQIEEDNSNEIELTGFICKNPVYRSTRLGKDIADIIIAVTRKSIKNTRADYIPCVVWGTNALYVKDYSIGTLVHLKGYLRSRKYPKIIEGQCVEKIAYEVSAEKIEKRKYNK